jgi:hypothetical protein
VISVSRAARRQGDVADSNDALAAGTTAAQGLGKRAIRTQRLTLDVHFDRQPRRQQCVGQAHDCELSPDDIDEPDLPAPATDIEGAVGQALGLEPRLDQPGVGDDEALIADRPGKALLASDDARAFRPRQPEQKRIEDISRDQVDVFEQLSLVMPDLA